MRRYLLLVWCSLFVGVSGAAHAAQLEGGSVIIDGLPCGAPCQEYMAWSRRLLPMQNDGSSGDSEAAAPVGPSAQPKTDRIMKSRANGPRRAAPTEARRADTKQRVTRNRSPSAVRPQAQSQHDQPARSPVGAAKSQAPDERLRNSEARNAGRPNDKEAALRKPADEAITSHTPPAAKHPEPANAGAATGPTELKRTVTAATSVAEHEATEVASTGTIGSSGAANDAADAARESRDDLRVALVMARPAIESVSDLSGKTVAVDERYLSGKVRTAIAAAGALEVRLSPGDSSALDRIIDGEVEAAVLTLVSVEAADAFPDVPGYRIFRIPLSPAAELHGAQKQD